MKRFLILICILGAASLLASCSPAQENPVLQTQEGKLTFAFFYTDG